MVSKARFGPFEYDFAQQELRRNGLPVRLAASQLRLLTLFLDKPGVLIERDEIVARLWKDPEAIDVTNGINTAVNRLRSQLRDSPVKPIYIETVIGVGYRFVATLERTGSEVDGSPSELSESPAHPEHLMTPAADTTAETALVEVSTPPLSVEIVAAPETVAKPRHYGWRTGMAAAVVVLAVAGTALWYAQRPKTSTSRPEMPETWNHFRGITFNDSDNKVTAEAVAPSGEALAYSDRSGLSVIWLDSRAIRLLASPAHFQASRIDWYPDGKRLLLSGSPEDSAKQQVWQISSEGGAPKLLLEDAMCASVSPDGKRLAFVRHQAAELDLADAEGGQIRQLATAGDKQGFRFLLWSPSGNYLIAERSNEGGQPSAGASIVRSGSPLSELDALNQWSYQTIDVHSGKILAQEKNIHFESGFLLRNGHLFYPESNIASPITETRLMMVRTDVSNGRFLGAPIMVHSRPGDQATGFTSSLDGREVAIIIHRSTADLFVGTLHRPSFSLDHVTQVSHNAVESYPHAWTPKDDAVLIENNSLSKDAVFEQPLDGSPPRLMAELSNDAAMAEFTPDGKWILFLGFGGTPSHVQGIFRIPAHGGNPEQVPVDGDIDEFSCPAIENGTCVVRVSLDKKQFAYYALDPAKGVGKQLKVTAWEPSLLGEWAISPDGSTVAIANHDKSHPSVRFLGLASPTSLHDIPVEGSGTLLGVHWDVGGHGLFVESITESGFSLLYVDLKGHTKVLRNEPAPIWGIPSRDGTRLAFPAITFRSNVIASKLGEP